MNMDQLWKAAMSVKPEVRRWKDDDGNECVQYPFAMGLIQIDGHRVTASIEWVWKPFQQQPENWHPANLITPMFVRENEPLPIDLVRSVEKQTL